MDKVCYVHMACTCIELLSYAHIFLHMYKKVACTVADPGSEERGAPGVLGAGPQDFWGEF